MYLPHGQILQPQPDPELPEPELPEPELPFFDFFDFLDFFDFFLHPGHDGYCEMYLRPPDDDCKILSTEKN